MKRKLAIALATLPMIAIAQTKLDIMTPQVEMSKRVSAAAAQRAQELGLSNDALTYCRVKLNYKEDSFPRNGEIPFGVNYKQITSHKELSQVIAAREGYEKTFMLLCLSKVKQQLEAAK